MSPSSRTEAFAVLELEPGAPGPEIRRAYRRLAMRWHPDRNTAHGATERFRRIKAAHDYLLHGGEEYVPPAAHEPSRGPDQQETLWLELEEAIFGGVHVQELASAEPCAQCAGSGRVALRFSRLCKPCHGSGRVRAHGSLAACTACAGKGFITETPCEACHGSGERRAARRVQVTVPPLMWSGRTLRLSGQATAAGELAPGDLLLVTRIKPHGLFQVGDDTLEVEVPVSLFDLLAGVRVEVPVPGGMETVAVEAGTATPTRFSLPGHGLPLREGGRGELAVLVRPVFPEQLGKRDLAALAELRRVLAGRERKLFPSLAAWRERWLGKRRKKG